MQPKLTIDTLRDLIVVESLKIGPVKLESNSLHVPYTLVLPDGKTDSRELIYTYEEAVFDPSDATHLNLACMIAVQVSMNYGLFCNKIIYEGLFDSFDRKFIAEMMEITSREILINKLLRENVFLKKEFKLNIPAKQTKYTVAELLFTNSLKAFPKFSWNYWTVYKNKYTILSSGGKDSLLTYGLLKELQLDIHPVFVNESGRHWFTALNAYRYFKDHEPNTGRVWTNCDRLFSWMLQYMPFIRPDYSQVRSDDYPLRLWTVAVFLFGVLPLTRTRNTGRILIGNEYDCTQKVRYEGAIHYNGLYDQSRFFDNALSRYYLKKGWNINQFSVLRSLSEINIMKILSERYPELHENQVSCHAAHERNGRFYPCGKCEKCRRIICILTALDKTPEKCGYSLDMVKHTLKGLSGKTDKYQGADASQLYYMLQEKGIPFQHQENRTPAINHPEVLQLRFDNSVSVPKDIPSDLRQPLIRLYFQHIDGAVIRRGSRWEKFDVLNSEEIKISYPFEVSGMTSSIRETFPQKAQNYLWEELSWPQIQQRLREVDTAILPCGSIEQHGPHLPVDVDYFDAVYLARKVAEACSNPRPFVLPPIPYGVSYHHDDFKGTLSVKNETLYSFVYDIGMNLARNGIRKLVILNGHGDNSPTLNFASQMINRDANIFVCVETGETSDKDIRSLVSTKNDVHAGEIETSTTLAIRPELVKMDQARDMPLQFNNSYLDFTSARGVPWYVKTQKISENGTMGNPSRASAEKGTMIWEIMIAHLVRFIEEIKNSSLEDIYQRKY